jgi:hypothetical protein
MRTDLVMMVVVLTVAGLKRSRELVYLMALRVPCPTIILNGMF